MNIISMHNLDNNSKKYFSLKTNKTVILVKFLLKREVEGFGALPRTKKDQNEQDQQQFQEDKKTYQKKPNIFTSNHIFFFVVVNIHKRFLYFIIFDFRDEQFITWFVT